MTGKIKFPHASGNSMSIAAPATNPASDLELKLPATVGTAGQVLKNSSTPGTLEFGDASAGGASNISFNNGNGIDFSAAADTATGETVSSSVLDDYEEGTWTIATVADAGSASITTNRAYYIKIGSMVHLSCSFTITGNSSSSVIRISIPFTSNITSYYAGNAHCFSTYTALPVVAVVENSGASVNIGAQGSATGFSWAGLNGKRIDLDISYQRT